MSKTKQLYQMALLVLLVQLLLLVKVQGLSPPNGYLLALKVNQADTRLITYNHVSLFNVSLTGNVDLLWNISLDKDHLMFNVNGYAIDIEDQLVYLSISNEFLAVDLYTGKIVNSFPLQAPNLQFYVVCDYDRSTKTFYGICSGNSWWNWCSSKLETNRHKLKLDFLYQLPYTNEWGPINSLYDIDIAHQLIWYMPSYLQTFVIGLNTTSGGIVFKSGPSNATCICHDKQLNRTFGIVQDILHSTINLTEILPYPEREKVILKLPYDLRLDYYNSCTMSGHVILVLMGSMDLGYFWYHGMPTHLLMIDVIELKYTRVPLPEFKLHWDSSNSITGVRYFSY